MGCLQTSKPPENFQNVAWSICPPEKEYVQTYEDLEIFKTSHSLHLLLKMDVPKRYKPLEILQKSQGLFLLLVALRVDVESISHWSVFAGVGPELIEHRVRALMLQLVADWGGVLVFDSPVWAAATALRLDCCAFVRVLTLCAPRLWTLIDLFGRHLVEG